MRLRRQGFEPAAAALVFLAVVLAPSRALDAAEVRFLESGTQEEFLAGTLDRIAVDPLGTLTLADRAEKLTALEEPFVFALAEHPQGWVVGTGNSGRVLLVRRDGSVETLLTADEPEIFAVWADRRGVVYAGSSPDGKVYRVEKGESRVLFDPEETYVWDLEGAADGSLFVATGLGGRLYRVDKSGRSELLYDTEDAHVRSIKILTSGDVLMGTAGDGLLLRWREGVGPRTLFDSAYPEVVSLAEGPDGSCYAAVLASEASLTDLSRQGAETKKPAAGTEGASGEGEDKDNGAEGSAKVSVSVQGASSFTGSRPATFSGPRSQILKVSPQGTVETVWSFKDETAYSLAWQDDRLWVGTGLEGKLFSLRDRRMVLEKDLDERQIVALAAGSGGPVLASTNGAAVFRLSSASEQRGTYTSAALDAGQVAGFGTLSWRGQIPAGAAVRFSARSGLSAEPDRTWSAWSAWQEAGSGHGVKLESVPPGRFLQWRAELESSNGASPRLTAAAVSYLQHNLAPTIKSLKVLDPGQVLVPSNFNPSNQVFEPFHPNRDGIFTTLGPVKTDTTRGRKTLWKKGYRTLSWDAEDPNQDELRYALHFRRDGSSRWLPIAEELEEKSYSFDATVLPDGLYRFRLRAYDREPGDGEAALADEEVTRAVVLDQTAPALESVTETKGKIRLELSDAWNPLRQVEVSRDAKAWEPVEPLDGLLDGLAETFMVERPADAELFLMRVMDAAFNSATFDILRELP